MAKRGRPPYPDILTPREWEVLGLLREGLSNPEIAQRLGISRAGAKYHVSEILSKLGLGSREEAARWEPTKRPWWDGALAPVFWLRQQATALPIQLSVVAAFLSGALFVTLLAGLGSMVFLLLRDNDGRETEFAVVPTPAPPMTPGATVPNQTPLAPAPTAGNQSGSLPLRPDQSMLYAVNADGSGLREVFAGADDFKVSPDGRKLAVAAREGKDGVVYLVDPQTGDRQEIARAATNYVSLGGWSPDGAWLAFSMYEDGVHLYSIGTGELSPTLVEDGTFAVWGPSSDAVFVKKDGDYAGRPSTLYRVALPDLVITDVMRGTRVRDVAMSPSGDRLAVVLEERRDGEERAVISLLDADGSEFDALVRLDEGRGPDVYDVAWSPDGRRLAYSLLTYDDDRSAAGIYLVDVATGVSTQITQPEDEFDVYVTWSEDGSRLLVTRYSCVQCDGGATTLVLADADGSGATVLGKVGEYSNIAGTWSPDGSRIAYGADALYVADADGSNVRTLARPPDSSYGVPSWSPDGSHILFVQGILPFTAYEASADGSSTTPLGRHVLSVSPDGLGWARRGPDGVEIHWPGGTATTLAGYVYGIAWSPDGKAVLFREADEPGMRYQVTVLRSDGSRHHPSLAGEPSASDLLWSPDGGLIAYRTERGVWVVDPTGGTPRLVAETSGWRAYDWSPDGSEIAVATDDGAYAVRVDGSGSRRLLFEFEDSPISPTVLKWSPGGEYVAVAHRSQLSVWSLSTGEERHVTDDFSTSIAWSPDGDRLLFSVVNTEADLARGLYLMDVASGEISPFTEAASYDHVVLAWLADGRIIFQTFSAL